MSHVVMLLSNAFRPDPRVDREARALLAAGHRVTLICWDRESALPPREERDGLTVIRVQSVASAYGSGWRQLFRLPRFWQEAIRLATPLRPDIIHCHDLDTLYAGRRIKRQIGARLVYDAHEHYPALMSLYLPGILVQALVGWERWLLRSVDAIITASTVLRDKLDIHTSVPAITLGNYQELAPFQAVTHAQILALRQELGLKPDDLMVAYIGGFSRNRMMLPLIQAAARHPHIQFHLWGDGAQRSEVEAAAQDHANVTYHGWLPADQLPLHFKAADIIVYCLRTDYAGAIYNAPNTLSNAMAAGRPIIANRVGDLGRIVAASDCGVLIDEATAQAISEAIQRLRDPALRARLGANGLQAAQATYNAARMQEALTALYGDLEAIT